mgnify:CR=1 FL=1
MYYFLQEQIDSARERFAIRIQAHSMHPYTFYSQPVPEGTPRGLAYYSPNNEKLTEIRSKNARFPIK